MNLFGGKPKYQRDPRQDQLMRQQREQMAKQDSEIAERKASRGRFAKGRQSLISGAETGIPQRDTLG